MNIRLPEPNPLLARFPEIQSAIQMFREGAKKYYFGVLSSRYRCPKCEGRLSLIASSTAQCHCGLCFDATLEFQRCSNCGGRLLKKTSHYSCTRCGVVSRSIFLFDEKIFDGQYFRERMRESRERKRKAKAELRQMLITSRSTSLQLTDEVDLNNISGLQSDLDSLLGIGDYEEKLGIKPQGQSFRDYQRHIYTQLDSEILFSAITSLYPDEKKDKVFRFVSLIFMEQDQIVWLSKLEDDILVEKYEAIREG